jgi:hypothetical protein
VQDETFLLGQCRRSRTDAAGSAECRYLVRAIQACMPIDIVGGDGTRLQPWLNLATRSARASFRLAVSTRRPSAGRCGLIRPTATPLRVTTNSLPFNTSADVCTK